MDAMSQAAPQFNRPGAVDLSAFAPSAPAGETVGANYAVEATEANFNQLVSESMQYPVVFLLTSARDQGSVGIEQMLTRLASAAQGRWLLGRIDVDSQPRLAQALQVAAVPTTIAVIAGQALPLFQGTRDEAEVKAYLDQVVEVAAANGVHGRAKPQPGSSAAESTTEPALDPRFAAADEAMQRGDYATAVREFEALLNANPRDTQAAAGRATAALLLRVGSSDPAVTIRAALSAPGDLEAQMAAADAEMVLGQPSQAFERLIGLIRTTSGDDRDRLRRRLLELFDTMDPADPDLLAARRALGAALY